MCLKSVFESSEGIQVVPEQREITANPAADADNTGDFARSDFQVMDLMNNLCLWGVR